MKPVPASAAVTPAPASAAVTPVPAVVLARSLGRVHGELAVLKGVDLDVREGEQVALLGPSGSGKSTMLSLLAGLQRPSSGSLVVAGTDMVKAGRKQLTQLRRDRVGLALQDPGRGLFAAATALLNVEAAQPGVPRAERRRRGAELLERVGLPVTAGRPATLSGGEQQRLQLACVLARRPTLLLADEPTSQLDRTLVDTIVSLLLDVAAEQGSAVLLVTHDEHVAQRCSRVVRLHDGELA